VTEVQLKLIGGFELRREGEPVDLPMSAQRLVAYLALRGRPLLRIHVAGTLWLDSSEERSCANLRSALWRLGGPARGVVEATASHVGLSRDVVVDMREVIALARDLLEQADDADDVEIESSGLAMDLLPDWYDEWVLLERERLRELRVHALERLAERATRQGRFAHAIDTALTAIQADPLRESAHRVLIKAYLAEGNGGAGIRQYHEYCRRAHDELGVGPSSQLREIVAGFSPGRTTSRSVR
jgi:DNA-binding SARP family transcriptional activator